MTASSHDTPTTCHIDHPPTYAKSVARADSGRVWVVAGMRGYGLAPRVQDGDDMQHNSGQECHGCGAYPHLAEDGFWWCACGPSNHAPTRATMVDEDGIPLDGPQYDDHPPPPWIADR